MPKPHTFPTLYDEVLQLNITRLKKWGYLDDNQVKTGTITWSRNGSKTGSISIKVNTLYHTPQIELNYSFRDEPRRYKLDLVSLPSNLGKGEIWYFLCPHTGKRCRILYSVDGYFFHRSAFKGVMYEKQTFSKKWRQIECVFGAYFDCEKYYRQIHAKHFTKYYKGKPTKKYLKLMAKIEEADRIDGRQIERLLMS